jgi:putative flippase GtrA
MGPSPIAVSMKEEEDDDYGPFCNYCGKLVSIGLSAYKHVVEEHGAEVHTGPGGFDPERQSRSSLILYAGFGLTLAIHFVIMLLLWEQFDDMTGPLWAASFIGSIVGTFIYSEFYARKGVRPESEIMEDLLVKCEICGTRVARRDIYRHSEVQHPDEHATERRVYDRVGIAIVALIVAGFAGMYVSYFLEDGDLSGDWVVLFAASLATVVIGVALAYLFEKRYREPRMKRLAREWDERHPGSRKE